GSAELEHQPATRRTAGSRGVGSASWAGAGPCPQLWSSFAPVTDTVSRHFLLSTEQINWFSLAYLVVTIPFGVVAIWVLDSAGLRWPLHGGWRLGCWKGESGLVGSSSDPSPADRPMCDPFAFLTGGQSLCALAQTLVISPAKLAACGFPSTREPQPTRLALSNSLGILVANPLSPTLVKKEEDIPLMVRELRRVGPAARGHWASTSSLLAPACVWESKPPAPPSAGAVHSTAQKFLAGLELVSAACVLPTSSWPLAACLGGSIGIFSSFSSLLEQILCVNGLCGALFVAFGASGALPLGLSVDQTEHFAGAVRMGPAWRLWSAGLCPGESALGRDHLARLAATCSLLGPWAVCFSAAPVAVQLAVDRSFPVGEGGPRGLVAVQAARGCASMALLASLTVRRVEVRASTLLVTGLCVLFSCLGVLFLYTPYRRLQAEADAAPLSRKTCARQARQPPPRPPRPPLRPQQPLLEPVILAPPPSPWESSETSWGPCSGPEAGEQLVR
uniref:Solute carrier family 49 member A3 n=1 Tax=Phocoena sinus TaxID=42100 RepID=A0A8C9E7P4_PHOSS